MQSVGAGLSVVLGECECLEAALVLCRYWDYYLGLHTLYSFIQAKFICHGTQLGLGFLLVTTPRPGRPSLAPLQTAAGSDWSERMGWVADSRLQYESAIQAK